MIDAVPVGTGRVAVVVFERSEVTVEAEDRGPPFVEADVASTDGSEPLGGFALDRQSQLPGRQKLDALEAEAGAVHGVLGVVPVGSDELFPSAIAPLAVAATAGTEETLGLGLHVAAIAGNDVASDEGVAEGLQVLALRRGVIDGAHRAIRIDGLPEVARRMNRRREWSVRSTSPGPERTPSGWVRCITVGSRAR